MHAVAVIMNVTYNDTYPEDSNVVTLSAGSGVHQLSSFRTDLSTAALVTALVSCSIMIILELTLIVRSLWLECASSHSGQYSSRLALGIYISFLLIFVNGIVIVMVAGEDDLPYYYAANAVLTAVVTDLIYIFMMRRLHQTFNETAFRVSRAVFVVHSLVIIYSSIGELCAFVIFDILLIRSIENEAIVIIVAQLPWLLFCLGLAHLVWMFNVKLFRLVLLKRRTIVTADDAGSLTGRQLKLLQTIRKHTLLGSLLVMSCLAFVVTSVVTYYVSKPQKTLSSVPYWLFVVACISTESVSIFAGFRQSDTTYRWLCGFCDVQCKSICMHCAEHGLYPTDTRHTNANVMAESPKPMNHEDPRL